MIVKDELGSLVQDFVRTPQLLKGSVCEHDDRVRHAGKGQQLSYRDKLIGYIRGKYGASPENHALTDYNKRSHLFVN